MKAMELQMPMKMFFHGNGYCYVRCETLIVGYIGITVFLDSENNELN